MEEDDDDDDDDDDDYLQYVPASKLFEHAWFEVLAKTLCFTWSDNWYFQDKLVL